VALTPSRKIGAAQVKGCNSADGYVSAAVLNVDQSGGQAAKETPVQTGGTLAVPVEKKAEAKPSPPSAPLSSPQPHPGGTPQSRAKKAPLRALIIDGQSNHDFRGTSEGIRGILASTGRFGDWSHVTVSRSPIWWEQREPFKPKTQDPADQEQFTKYGKSFNEARQAYYKQSDLLNSIWRPPFGESDVVILNYNGSSWPDDVQQAFTRFVENGGGVVVVHAANNAFEKWPAYNQMLGIGWRSPAFGRWIAVDDTNGQLIEVPEEKPAASTHGDFIPFVVKTRAPHHPIMAGFPDEWMHAADELYARMRGSSEGLELLATAFSPFAKQHEPVVWCKNYGKGRVVTTSMGHYQRPAHYSSLNCVGFEAVLARSCEWAATGTVTIPVPADFPTKDGSSVSPPKPVRWKGQ
jgi:type 1 glutamine amidotransferase